VETIARPAFWTACGSTTVLLFLALLWNANKGLEGHGPKDGSVLLVLLLGAPSAVAAYISQAVQSRVTNAVLYGLRLAALLPASLAVIAGGVVLVGEMRHPAWSYIALWGIFGLSAVTVVTLWLAQYLAEHPREQRHVKLEPRPWLAGRDSTSNSGTADTSDQASRERVRDLMLGRGRGLSALTRATLFEQRGIVRDRVRIPPALYFDSAETPPSFSGFACKGDLDRLRSQVHRLINNCGVSLELLNAILDERRD
jgi:hypothetical protein